MNGLYALKPWWAARLARPRTLLIRRGVAPAAVSWAGVVCAAGAGALLWRMRPGAPAGVAVGGLLAARLACANLDGGLARATGRGTPWGSVVNELTDRMADLLALAGLAAIAPVWLVALAGLGATLPSWVSLAGAAAAPATWPRSQGEPGRRVRIQGGPVGKTERAALLVVAAFTGQVGGVGSAVAAVIAVGGVITAAVRLRAAHRMLGGAR